MRSSFSLFLFLSIFFLSCSSTPETIDPYQTEELSAGDVWVDDFTPPSEVDRGYEGHGPFEHRLLTATSEDGVTWEKTNILLVEQGNTPDMAIKDDVIYLYYTGGNFDGKEQGIAVALSKDGGESWTFKRLTIEGYTSSTTPGDPDIILLEDGTFRLYFTAQIEGEEGPGIFYAEGTDGLNFTYKGKAFSADGYTVIDSSAFIVNGEWMMLTFNGFDVGVIHGSSSDGGRTFEFIKSEDIIYKHQPYFMANPLTLEDGSVRFYAFQFTNFRSFISEDGLSWEDEGHTLLEYEEGANELEGFYIKDPAVVQLEDGTYLMVYVTRAPLE